MNFFKRIAAACAALVLVAGATRLAAQERAYVVIVNEANDVGSVSTDELQQLFTKRMVRWTSGQPVTPVDLSERSMVRANFSQEVHHKATVDVKSFWQTVVFSGRGVPPTEVTNEAAAVEFVRANPGAIGYVSAATPLGQGVRALRIRR